MSSVLTLEGFVKNVAYTPHLAERLPSFDMATFNINDAPSCGLLLSGQHQLAYSKWVSPKRTRSYPFERIYNTFNASKIATIIPIIKDEGKDGDIDKIQYSTFSWMNLMNVYVVLAYYETAEKNTSPTQQHKHKVTNQRFNVQHVQEQLNAIVQYRQSALHWNRTLLEDRFTTIFTEALVNYRRIETTTGVQMHPQKPLERYIKTIQKDFAEFKELSLRSSQRASTRETRTIHKHEFLQTETKAQLIITNYLGGSYYLTVDEVFIEHGQYVLQESKNTTNSVLPSLADIKDGLFKLMLFSNIDTLWLHHQEIPFTTRLHLTGRATGGISFPKASEQEMQTFIKQNHLTTAQQKTIELLQREAENNRVEIQISSNAARGREGNIRGGNNG